MHYPADLRPSGTFKDPIVVRSAGDEVNAYFFGAPETQPEPVARPMFRLLYRPSVGTDPQIG